MRPVPDYLHAKLEEQYGPSLAARIEAGFRHERATTLRVNTLKASRDQVQEQLAEAGLRTQTVAWYADALVVAGVDEQRAERWLAEHANDAVAAAGLRNAAKKGDRARTGGADASASAPDPAEAHAGRPARPTPLGVLRAHPLYTNGALYLQSLSAMVPALLVAPRAGQSVLDMCAAPGGKTCQLAALSNNQALITACEKNPMRAERLRYNLAAQDARANVMVEDARRLDPYFSFDAALLDAPCSGSGTVQLMDARQAKRQRFEADLLARTVRTQQALLARALELVPAGGVVTYSTCSILADENEEVVRAALEQRLAAGGAEGEKRGGGRDGRHGRKRCRGGRQRRGSNRSGSQGAFADNDVWGAASFSGGNAGCNQGARGARRSPAVELVPIDPERFSGMPLLPTSLEGTLCVRPTDLYEGFFVAQLKKL